MTSQGPTRRPPTGFTRFFLRMPIWLYRLKLGWLMGNRFLLLNHVGRKSGQIRQAVVEVVRHDKASDAYIIASGFGEQSQWFQNLLQAPDASIQVGSRKLAVRARRLTAEEGGAEMVDYAHRHATAARKLAGYMGFVVDGSDEGYRQVGAAISFFRLEPRKL